MAQRILGGRLIELLGGTELEQTLLPQVIAGDLQLALAYSERHSGDNPTCVSCQVARAGDDYVITGDKIMVLNGANADKLLVTGRRMGDERDRMGIEVLVVGANSPGISRRGYPTVDGMRAADSRFDQLRLCIEALLGSMDYHLDRYAMLMADSSQ